MGAERVENSTQSAKVILVEVQRDSEVWYQPVEVNRKAHDSVSAFIIKEKTRLRGRLKDLRTVPRRDSRGREVARKSISEIVASREKVIRSEHLEEKIVVLEGKELKPVRLVMQEDFVKGFEIVNFVNKEQEEWWKFMKGKDLLNSLALVAKAYPQGLGILQDVYRIRGTMAWGSPDERNQAKEEFEDVIRKTREIPQEHDRLMVPLLRVITEHIAKLSRP